MIPDELLFTIDYQGKKKGIRFDLKDKSKEELAYALARVIEEIGDLAYNFSDLKLKYKEFESLEDAIKKAREMKKENLKELSNLVDSAAVYYYLKDSYHIPTPKMFKKIKEEKIEPKVIGLIVKYKNWFVAKKTIKEAEDWEIAFLLSGIVETLIKKIYELMGKEDIERSKKDMKKIKAMKINKEEDFEKTYQFHKELLESGLAHYPEEELYYKYIYKHHPELKPIISRKKRAAKKKKKAKTTQ